jgi:REP-associated tyrosine transposase
LFWYLLAVVSKRHWILVHCVQMLATHYHAVVTDPRGEIPNFLQQFHLALAMTTKCLRRWDEEVFNKSQTSRPEHETLAATIDQCAYVIANCVEAGIVDRPGRYPGPKTLASDIGTARMRFRRPQNPWLVDEKLWPATAELCIEMHPGLEAEYGAEGARQLIQDAVDAKVQKARAERTERGLGYFGAKDAMRVPHTTQSTQPEPIRGRNPTFVVGPGMREAFFRKVDQLREWRAAYRDALQRWRLGERDVEFPPGTWKMRILHGARVAPPPD